MDYPGSIVQRGTSFRVAVSLGKDPESGKRLYHRETVRGTWDDARRRLGVINRQQLAVRRRIVELRHIRPNATLQGIADEVGVSRQRVHQLLCKEGLTTSSRDRQVKGNGEMTSVAMDRETREILRHLATTVGLSSAAYLRILIHTLGGNPHTKVIWEALQQRREGTRVE